MVKKLPEKFPCLEELKKEFEESARKLLVDMAHEMIYRKSLIETWPEYFGHRSKVELDAMSLKDVEAIVEHELLYGLGTNVPNGIYTRAK